MLLVAVRRPAETVQIADGFTCIEETAIASQHRDDALQVAFVDGHVGWVSHQEWRQALRSVSSPRLMAPGSPPGALFRQKAALDLCYSTAAALWSSRAVCPPRAVGAGACFPCPSSPSEPRRK